MVCVLDRANAKPPSENTPVAMGGVGINISEEGVVVIVRIRPKSSKEQDEKTCLRVQGPMQVNNVSFRTCVLRAPQFSQASWDWVFISYRKIV